MFLHSRAVVSIASTERSRQPRHAKTLKTHGSRHGVPVAAKPPVAKVGTWGVAIAVAAWAAVFVTTTRGVAGPTNSVALTNAMPSPNSSPIDSMAAQTANPVPAQVSGLAASATAAATRQPASVGYPPVVRSTLAPNLPVSFGSGVIPRLALAAYVDAANSEARTSPGCGLNWTVLAGIGLIESDHARSGGSASLTWSGVASPAILGPLLDGNHGYPALKDSDDGVLDGNPSFDRAVGPMQFLPSTWHEYAVSATGVGTPDPENIFDAAAAAGRYLCASGINLDSAAGLIVAVYGYNHSFSYVTNVVSAAQRYAGGTLPGASVALTMLPALVAETSSTPQ